MAILLNLVKSCKIMKIIEVQKRGTYITGNIHPPWDIGIGEHMHQGHWYPEHYVGTMCVCACACVRGCMRAYCVHVSMCAFLRSYFIVCVRA